MREIQIQTSLIEQLRELGYLVIRHNPISPLIDGGFKRLSPYDKGTPDVIVFGNSRCIFLEVKTERGNQSIYQKAFQKAAKKAGIPYFVVRSPEEGVEICQSLQLDIKY